MAAATATVCQVDSDLIKPEMIPGDDIDPAAIAGSASGFSAAGTAVTEKGAAVVTQWAALSGVYVAPEAPELLDVMTPVSVDSAALGQTLTSVSKIIADFADQVAPLKSRLAAIREDARAFVARVSDGVTVDIWDSDHPAREAGIFSFMVTDFADMGPQTITWREHKPSVQENSDLIHRVNAEAAALDQARADCVNAINALRTDQCVAGVVAYTAADLNAEGVTLPWGAATDGDRSCSESTGDAVVDFGKGFGGAVVGSVEGLGALFSYNAATGNWGDGDMAGQAWSGLGMLGAGLVLAGPISITAGLIPKKNVPEWLHGTQDFINGSQEQLLAGVKGMVASDQWAENPAGALGATTFNIGSFFIPGAGVAAGGAKVASIGGKAGLVVAHVAEVVLPGVNVVSRGAASLTLHAGQGLTVLADAAKLNIAGGASIGRASLAQAMHSLADQIPTVHIEPGFAAVTSDGAVFGAPPRLAIGEPGSGGHALHTIADRVDAPRVDAPVPAAPSHVDVNPTNATPSTVADAPAGGTHTAVPDGAVPDVTAPDGAVPDGAAPDGAVPDSAATDVTGPAPAQTDFHVPGTEKTIDHAIYQETLAASVHNADAAEVMLGKWDGGGPTNYVSRAEEGGYEYFSLGDKWDPIMEAQKLDMADMFTSYNVPFLDDAIAAGKTFHFSHDPIGDTGSLLKEFEYLKDSGYRYDPETMTATPPTIRSGD
ncbi:hypothetical protein GY21_20210 [Cryobacterium roopkundense]|uniref:Tox-REase-5 domain-containing protein n=1 Tax=Cryobacterium roopkundense TaxID=1001240 RepID=A0A099J2G3_9MICO|nr:hypothetical protein [Cryobacterium roopkundense]KGJ71732.1 hypothetical protein GY21_20210 [Cryobacterium roopkundense]MBB5642545.1 hypothetical protein [Cryobacterium roopkundense]